jgi:hypothetical protein
MYVRRRLANQFVGNASATQDNAKPLHQSRVSGVLGGQRFISSHETCFYQLPYLGSLIRDNCYRVCHRYHLLHIVDTLAPRCLFRASSFRGTHAPPFDI